jgi:hypothetical protein
MQTVFDQIVGILVKLMQARQTLSFPVKQYDGP